MTKNVIPCDNKTVITYLTENRALRNLIEEYIASDDCDDEIFWNDYNAAKKLSEEFDLAKKDANMAKGKVLFEKGKTLEAAN